MTIVLLIVKGVPLLCAFMTYYNNTRVVQMLNGYKQNLNIGFKIKIIYINKYLDRNNIWYPNYYHRLNNNMLFNLCYYLLYQ